MKKYSVYYRSCVDNGSLHFICKNVDYNLAKDCFLDFVSINFNSKDLDCIILLEHSCLSVENLSILYDLEHCSLPNFDYFIRAYCSLE